MTPSKYPGISILYEVGTRKELAQSYGVSERTLYRWLNKAKAESGERQEYPGAARIAQFKGTRKELAKKYNISERTAYRWINKAKEQGANIPSRINKSRYPGPELFYQYGTNKELADEYGVSESTIRRWKARARSELESIDPMATANAADLLGEMPEEITDLPEMPEEIFTDDQPGQEETSQEETSQEEKEDPTTALLFDLLKSTDQLVEDSLFYGLERKTQLSFLNAYVQYQDDQNHKLFYDPEIHDFNYTPEFVSTINIWGDEFETWIRRELDLEDFSSDWIDNINL